MATHLHQLVSLVIIASSHVAEREAGVTFGLFFFEQRIQMKPLLKVCFLKSLWTSDRPIQVFIIFFFTFFKPKTTYWPMNTELNTKILFN